MHIWRAAKAVPGVADDMSVTWLFIHLARAMPYMKLTNEIRLPTIRDFQRKFGYNDY